MPSINGLELIRCAKQINPGAQVFLVTGHSTLGAVTDALELGAADYLLKPVDQLELIELIKDAGKRLRRWRAALASTLAKGRGRVATPAAPE